MLKFSFKFFMLITLLLFGMLLGMNIAEKGLYSIAGNPEMTPESFQVQQTEDKLEVKVLGEAYVSDIPETITTPAITEEPQQKGQVSKQDINFMGNLGNKLGEILHIGAEKSLTIIAKLVE